MKRKFRKFWREWGVTMDEFLWFLIIPFLSLFIFLLTIIVLILL